MFFFLVGCKKKDHLFLKYVNRHIKKKKKRCDISPDMDLVHDIFSREREIVAFAILVGNILTLYDTSSYDIIVTYFSLLFSRLFHFSSSTSLV